MKYRIFISSVQRELAKERKALAEYLRKDAILGRFFEVFLFEEVPAQERKADGVYLAEVDDCDIYLGIFGHTYGNVDSRGVSATEREYRRAAARHKYRICFVDKSAGETDPRQAAFISRVNDDVVRKGFVGYDDLRTAVYAALAKHLEDKGLTIILRRANIAPQPQTDRGGANASQTAPKHHRDAFDDALESRLLDALRKDASSDQVELSKILGVSRATVQRCFKRLLKAGKVGRIGGKRFGHWEVLA